MVNISDEKLVEQYLAGDEMALEALIRRYLRPIYSFVYKNVGDGEAAEDITQETFVKMWKNLKRHEGSFKSWIFTIAKNSSIDFLRKSRSAFGGKKTIPLSFVEEFFVEKNDILEVIEQKEILGVFNTALNKLSPNYQKLVLLRHQSGLTFREIAQSLGEPLNTIKSRYRRATVALKKLSVNF